MAEGLIPTLAKDDTPHLDSSFSFHTEDSSPLETPKIGFPSKISVFSGEASPIRVISPSALSRKPGKTGTFITPPESASTLFASTRHGSMIKINGEPFSPERKLSRMMTRRSTFLEPGTPRKSKVFKVLPICSIGEQDMAAEDQEAEARKNKPARERTRDLNSMSTDELLDLAVKILKKESDKRNIRELQALSKCVAQVGFFKDCDKDTTMKCLRHMSYERFRTNQTVFEINTMGTTFWVILRGSIGVWVNVKKVVGVNEDGEDIVEEVLTEVKTLPAGSSFGELALLESKKKRAASIVCKEDCEFAVLEKSHFVAILKEKETRKLYNEVDFLVSLPLFHSWSYNGVKYLYYNTTVQKYKRGHVFYDEGDAPQKMYIVRSGELKLLKLANGKDDKSKDPLEKFKAPIFKKIVEMGIIGEKAIIGEEELLLDCKRKYKLVCHSLEAEVCEISKSVFLEKMLKFPHTKEWLNNYVKTREEYYQSRLKTIHQSTPLTSIATPQLSFSQKEAKDSPSRLKSPSKQDIVAEISNPIEPIPSAFLRAAPKKSGKRNSPDCRLTHTESDSQRNETQLATPKLVIPFGNLAFSEFHNAEKEQLNNERILMEQLDMKFYETPSRRQLQLSRNASKGSRGSRERRSPKDTPHSPEDGTVISFRDEVERLKKRVSTPHTNSARKETEKEKSTFYISKMEQTLTLKTEESIGTLTNIHSNRDIKPIREQLAHDYGLEKSLSQSNVSPIGRRPMTTTSLKRPFTGQTGRSSAKDSAVLYNRTFTDMGDTSQSSRLTLTDFKPSIENVSLKRLGQIESMKQKLLASMKPKKPPKLYVQGFSASFENVGFSQTARSSTSRTKKLFLASKKEAVRNVSTSIEKRPKPSQEIKVWDLLQTERSKNETTIITKPKFIPDLMKKANVKRKTEITIKSENGKVFLL